MLEDEENGAATESSDELSALQKALEEEKAKVDSHWQRLLRMQAEFENANRRATKDLENAHKYGIEKIINELLPVVDSLERGLEGKENDQDSLTEGVRLTLNLLQGVLERFHVTSIFPQEEKFDPSMHEAMAMQESDLPPGTVLAVIQKGYRLHDRVLRPARVMVSRAKMTQKMTDQEA